MVWISYAQNGEDVVLRRAFPDKPDGFYIDIGAHDPDSNSVTKHFYDRGWHGLNVEPASEPYAKLCRVRTRDENVPCGVSDHEGTATLFEAPAHVALSTFHPDIAAGVRAMNVQLASREVHVTTLTRLCEEHVGDRPVDFMSVDVEGHEREVLSSGDFRRFRPRVVVVEATLPSTTIPSHAPWEGILLGAGYVFTLFDGLNRFYVREEDRDLVPRLSVPANITDDFVRFTHVLEVAALEQRIESSAREAKALEQRIESSAREAKALEQRIESSAREAKALEQRIDALESTLSRISEMGPVDLLRGRARALALSVTKTR